ncbi:transcriptional regulator [Marinicauda salina]|uniref:Transcriptional regulator n=1 Tax=Marinicauda salina TaxID=2135793 RepID=A0A2U2BTZ0_9PROT|nr:helix-turn-helix domain-containing protein [Marinicauda salina]PWE17488.1 transcriptional regulator [Marinicauda salina]
MQVDYKQFCPVAMAAEVLCTRWTMVLLRELVAGSTRFNDLRRGVPRMSPALLSQRLKDLEAAGIVERKPVSGGHEYALTEAGRDLRAVVEAIGVWGQRWVESEPSLEKLDPSLLMWDMRRNLKPDPLPERRCVIQFHFTDRPAAESRWWLIVDPDATVDLCSVDPGFELDLLVTGHLRTMTAIWMGLDTVADATERADLSVDGDPDIASGMQDWLGLSPFAPEPKRVS